MLGWLVTVSRDFLGTFLHQERILTLEHVLMSQVVQQEALTRLLIKKGIHREGVLENGESGRSGDGAEENILNKKQIPPEGTNEG